MNLSFQKLFFTIATLFAIFAVLILAKAVLIPLAFSFLIAFILFPICRKLESWGLSKALAAASSMLSTLLLIGGGIFLFSNQIIQLSEDFGEFKEQIIEVFADVTLYVNSNVGFVDTLESGELIEKLKDWFSESGGSLIGKTFSGTSDFIVGLISTLVFTFLILIYRNGLINGFVHFYQKENRGKALKMFKSIQKVGQKYLLGMLVMIFILGMVNSIGLWVIGIDNPFLFGFLAGVLAIIPYAGTLIGAAIPILYAFMTYDSIWMPVTIAIFFWFVQFTESNFLSPRIVGSNLKLNAFASILSIIIGASVWGIAGMILFLPLVAMLKVVCENYSNLEPLALLIGDKNFGKEDENEGSQNKWVKKVKDWVAKIPSMFKNGQSQA